MACPNETLREVAEQTFEALAFMFALAPEEAAADDGERIAVCVDFSGPFSGRLCVKVAPDMLHPLAANMLGIDEPEQVTPEHQVDALKELSNVICGNILPQLAGPEAVFDVHAPQTCEAARTCDARERTLAEVRLALDEGNADVRLLVDAAVASLVGQQ